MAWDFAGAFGRGWEQGQDIGRARRQREQDKVAQGERGIAAEDRQRRIEQEIKDRARQRDLDELAERRVSVAEKMAGIQERGAAREKPESAGNIKERSTAQQYLAMTSRAALAADEEARAKLDAGFGWWKSKEEAALQKKYESARLTPEQAAGFRSTLEEVGEAQRGIAGLGERMARPSPGGMVAPPPPGSKSESREERIKRLMKNPPAGGVGGTRRPLR